MITSISLFEEMRPSHRRCRWRERGEGTGSYDHKRRGGRGAVREICDLLLKAKGVWGDIIDEYLSNRPTVLTLSRIVLIPVFIFTVLPASLFGAFIFSIASLTDFLDGYLARRSENYKIRDYP